MLLNFFIQLLSILHWTTFLRKVFMSHRNFPEILFSIFLVFKILSVDEVGGENNLSTTFLLDNTSGDKFLRRLLY